MKRKMSTGDHIDYILVYRLPKVTAAALHEEADHDDYDRARKTLKRSVML